MRRPKVAPAPQAASPASGKQGEKQHEISPEEQAIVDKAKAIAGHRYSKEETRAQMDIVASLWIEGYTEAEIKAKLRDAGHKVSTKRIIALKGMVQESFKLETERDRPLSKQRQLHRLYKLRRIAQGGDMERWKGTGKNRKKATLYVDPDHAALARYEDMIARLEGNYEPLKVDVDMVHREALIDVIGSLTTEQARELTEDFDRLYALAQAGAHATGGQLPAQLAPAITVQAESVTVNGSNGTKH